VKTRIATRGVAILDAITNDGFIGDFGHG
jgi:hypothetical protein